MKSRHRAREIALQILYRYDVAFQTDGSVPPTGFDLLKDLNHHFDHFHVEAELREFAARLVSGTLARKASIDEILEKHVANWKVTRLGFVDRSLLRMAVFEMIDFPETAPSIVIDEAVELGKQFGTADTPAFVNGVLDAVKGAVREAPTSS